MHTDVLDHRRQLFLFPPSALAVSPPLTSAGSRPAKTMPAAKLPVPETRPQAALDPSVASRANGFTLIEALVALAILAVAAAGIIGATERHIDTVSGLERRTAARWVAENKLAELSLTGNDRIPARERVEMLGLQ